MLDGRDLKVLIDFLLFLETTRLLIVDSLFALSLVTQKLLFGEEDVHVVELAVIVWKSHGFSFLLGFALA